MATTFYMIGTYNLNKEKGRGAIAPSRGFTTKEELASHLSEVILRELDKALEDERDGWAKITFAMPGKGKLLQVKAMRTYPEAMERIEDEKERKFAEGLMRFFESHPDDVARYYMGRGPEEAE